MTMHPPGRPREFKYKMRQEVIHHVHHGATVEEAARIVGVSLRTVQRAAKGDDDFHHDLHLALHHSQIDPQKLVERAARTHWRAAAWLLERTRPHEFAKRPPNSCSPETLQDMNDWLIETALEATPPEHRTAVYRRMRSVADKAFEILMPDQHEDRRRLVGSLPQRDMPLSSHEWGKTLETIVVHYPELESDASPPAGVAPVAGPPAEDASGVARPRSSAGRGAPGEIGATPTTPRADLGVPHTDALVPFGAQVGDGANLAQSPNVRHVHVPARPVSFRRERKTYDPAVVADPIAFYRAQPPEEPARSPQTHIGDTRLLDNERSDDESNYLSPEEEQRIEANLQYARAINAMRAERDEREAASAAAAAKSAKARSSASARKAARVDVSPYFRGATARADALIAAAAKRDAALRPAPATTRVAPVDGPPATGVAQRQEATLEEQPLVPTGPQVGEDANLGHPPHPPNEGIMSLKMQSATYPPATTPGVTANVATPSSAADRLRDLWQWRFRKTSPSPPRVAG
jgi:hypothetical protein